MLRSIVIPTDLRTDGDRAIEVGIALARRAAIPVELVHVSRGGTDAELDALELRARARLAEGLPCTTTVVTGEDTVAALVELFADRPDALIVLATRARGPLSELLLGSVSEALLARSSHPLLLVGPHVATDRPIGPSLIAAVANDAAGEILLPEVVEWSRSFAAEPWFVQVGRPTGTDERDRRNDRAEAGLVHRLAEAARAHDLDAQWDVLHGRNPIHSVIDFAASMDGGIVAVATERWADPTRIHWASTARSLVHRSPFPVLVVPVHRAAVAT